VKRFLAKLLFFISPFAALVILDAFLLPPDFFTFRTWEALKVERVRWALPGYFYPRMTVSKVEEGDLGHHTPYAVKKQTFWETDRFGYRKKDTGKRRAAIVVVGDSNVAGSGLSQREILSEVLEETLGVAVYPLSPGSMSRFLRDPWFRDNPPDTVILVSIERELPDLSPLKDDYSSRSPLRLRLQRLAQGIRTDPMAQAVAIPLDRAVKLNILHYTRARIRQVFAGSEQRLLRSHDGMLLLPAMTGHEKIPGKTFEQVLQIVRSYDAALKARGIRFILLPIPDKENIYYDRIPGRQRSGLLSGFIRAVKDSGIEIADTQRAFEEADRVGGTLLYQLDDTHWNGNGVGVAAGLAAGMIRRTEGVYGAPVTKNRSGGNR
jgi:alginate O-acetyltransferase complex protein AlgJ